jgi:hypothetical protein
MATTAKHGGGGGGHASAEQQRETHRHGLSRAAQRARWIESPDELADTRPGQPLVTRSHQVIQHWAEARGAEPAVAGKRHQGRPAALRFLFPDHGGDPLEHMAWADWLATFDDLQLVLLFQERLKNGSQSNFFRLDTANRKDG